MQRTTHRIAADTSSNPATLTPREHDILQCVLAGLSNKACAHTLDISVETARRHRAHLYRKYGVASAVALIARVAGDAAFHTAGLSHAA